MACRCAVALCCSVAGVMSAAAATATWLQDPALSPDGESIAFRSDGDLYITAVMGGQARLLRGTAAHEMKPVWLPDGRIAFAADTHGSYDVFIMSADDREPRRLTWHSRDEVPVGVSPDGRSLLIRSGRLDLDVSGAVYPMDPWNGEDNSESFPWAGIFSLQVSGGMPRMLIEPSSFDAALDTEGRLLFSVRPSSEVPYRKHELSPATSDLWLREDGRNFRQLTSFDGHDLVPAWNRKDGLIYYLSERGGSFNVWRMPITGDAGAERVTWHTEHPVRGLTLSATGSIAYSYRGELHVGVAGERFRKLAIHLPPRAAPPDSQPLDLSAAIRDAMLIPNRNEAVVVARGEVFVVEPSTQRRRALFAEYPGVKSWPTVSVDGRQLLVVRDRGDVSDLLLAQLPESIHSWLDLQLPLRTKSFGATRSETILRASLSPDGSRAAFTTGMKLRVISTRHGEARDLLTRAQGLVPSAEPIVWHPSGGHLALPWQALSRNTTEIAVVELADGTITNLTQSAFNDTAPAWSADGRALLWTSDREGLRNFGGEGAAVGRYALFLDPAAQRTYESQRHLTGGNAPSTSEVTAWLRDFRETPALLATRRVRFSTPGAAADLYALAPSGRFLLSLQRVGETSELWRTSMEGESTRVQRLPKPLKPTGYFRGIDSLHISADERGVLVLRKGAAHWIELAGGSTTTLELKEVAARKAAEEQRWIFEHLVRVIDRVYYRPEYLRAIDWAGYVAEYRRLLPAVSDSADFAELMRELLGELNASHTYFNYKRTVKPQGSGSLGVIYDSGYLGPGWRIAQLMPGSPLAVADESVRPGDIVTSVNGVTLPAGSDPAQFLLGTVGKATDVTVATAAGATRRLQVTPVSNAQESTLAYRRWVDWRQRETQRLSGGRLGYVHMPRMDEAAFRTVVDDVLGRFVNADAIVFDTRFNQGGWMHEPVLSFFAAPFAFDLSSNGTTYASEPALRAGRPAVVLINQANYSNGYETPRLFQARRIAKLIGEPMAGTGLGASGDPLPYWQYSYGIAHDVCVTPHGEYWEGVSQHPDILVRADRAALREGRDVQLEAAVRVLMEQLQ